VTLPYTEVLSAFSVSNKKSPRKHNYSQAKNRSKINKMNKKTRQQRVRYAGAAYQLCGRQADFGRVMRSSDHKYEYDRMAREYIANKIGRSTSDGINMNGKKEKDVWKRSSQLVGRYRPGAALPKINCLRRKHKHPHPHVPPHSLTRRFVETNSAVEIPIGTRVERALIVEVPAMVSFADGRTQMAASMKNDSQYKNTVKKGRTHKQTAWGYYHAY